TLFLSKNIILLGVIGFLLHTYSLDMFTSLSRLESFVVLGIISTVWFLIFALINFEQFKIFFMEIKKLKRS
ncbi:hypothetical protein MK079_05130, partial [Candidatus Gracilibacteria bacterium]|nr:hypothetical protein [Candidatus Gracilibacteria bacterium]